MTGLLERAEAEMRHAERGAEFLDQLRRQRQARSDTVGREGAPAATASQPDGKWPEPLAEAAYHGLAGRVVRTIAPHTESDPVAILVQYLAAFGSAVGRGPHYAVEGDRHGPNLFELIVGATAKGRKGTSRGRVQQIFVGIDDPWAKRCQQSGLSSGEGLIWAIRDPSGDDDPGVADKRLLVFEAEFASVLRVLEREGNRLSPVIRDAWDTGDLRTLTKTSPASASGAHISIIGHITADELRRYLSRTEAGNGFANRFLYICARRSQCLPDGGTLTPEALAPLAEETGRQIRAARGIGRVRMDDEARAIWHRVYPDLSEGMPGLLGAVTSRSEAQVIRIALLYCLLDGYDTMTAEHLRASLAVWDYCEASARYVFGDATGEPIADRLLRELHAAGTAGMTKTQISALFGNNRSAAAIDSAIALLERLGLISKRETPTAGRPATTWVAR